MDLQEYHSLAIRTMKTDYPPLYNLNNSALGLCGEYAEIMMIGEGESRHAIVKELGDLLWYCVQACEAIGRNIADIFLIDEYDIGVDDDDMLCAVGSFADIVKKCAFHDHPLDETAIGGIITAIDTITNWIEVCCGVEGISLDEVMQTNIDKLRKRYPAGFNSADSINRAE
jgi:NTP pyrophosphatase (non-canonical NTP hydrolase)